MDWEPSDAEFQRKQFEAVHERITKTLNLLMDLIEEFEQFRTYTQETVHNGTLYWHPGSISREPPEPIWDRGRWV